jgi:hypothetical protein
MTHVAFLNGRRLAHGPLAEIALAVREQPGALVFEEASGQQIDLDTRGSEADIRARHAEPARGPGRPRLGVTAREVTLLPRHWDWLSRQPGGASVALRRLVEAASREKGAARALARDATYRLASALAGNAPGFEEAMRALYAGKRKRFRREMEAWPEDVRTQLEKMAAPVFGDDDDE